MSKFIAILLALGVTACAAFVPPQAPMPDEKRRVPINKVVPAEVSKVAK